MKINLEVSELRELLKAQADGSPVELQRRIEILADHGRAIAAAEVKLRDLTVKLADARPQAEAQAVIDGAAIDVESLQEVWSRRPKRTRMTRKETLWWAQIKAALVKLSDRMGV